MIKSACCLLLIMLYPAACRETARGKADPCGADLVERFQSVSAPGKQEAADGSFIRHYAVVRNGVRRDAIVLIGRAAIRASLAGYTGRRILRGSATSVFNIGDGVELEVFLHTAGQKEARIFRRYFDPARCARDRAWIPLHIPINLVGPAADLEIRLSAGARGDLAGDWLALSELQILQQEAGL